MKGAPVPPLVNVPLGLPTTRLWVVDTDIDPVEEIVGISDAESACADSPPAHPSVNLHVANPPAACRAESVLPISSRPDSTRPLRSGSAIVLFADQSAAALAPRPPETVKLASDAQRN
jgi:hypothetical protein